MAALRQRCVRRGGVRARSRRTGRPAFAAWTAGLLIFAAAAGVPGGRRALGFSPPLFRAFYLLGGVLGVIWLSMGTLFLLAPRRVARGARRVLGRPHVVLAVDAAVVPVDARGWRPPPACSGTPSPHGSPLQVGAVVLNILGTLILVGGSAWSAYRLVRDRGRVDRVVCNVLLTVGALRDRGGLQRRQDRRRLAGHPRGLRGGGDRGDVRRLPGLGRLAGAPRPPPAAGRRR